MKLYQEFAEWWYLMSSPLDYEEEANLYWDIISKYKNDIQTALELGSGGGNNAFHLKYKCDWLLTDISPQMIENSKKLNPDCRHLLGDMRTFQIEEQFDLVFIHDAIMFITLEEDLKKVFAVAKKHLKPDGILFITPDFFKETFQPSTDCGGHDGKVSKMRYLEWTADRDPNDNVVETEYVYIFKNGQGETRIERETMQEGIFPQTTWKTLLEAAGFKVTFELMDHSEVPPGSYYGIVAQLVNSN